MATLAKLLDCLKWPRGKGSSYPIAPHNQVFIAADPETAFGWAGNLYASGLTTNGGANNIECSVPIPDDCFYILDATANASESGAAAGVTIRRAVLEIVDPSGNIAYTLTFGFFITVITAVGVSVTPPAEIYNLRLHLLSGSIVRWKSVDAFGVTGRISTSICLRKLYEEVQ